MALFPELSPAQNSLLDYFTYAANFFSCDQGIKLQLCQVFIPMAAESWPLMTSILALASMHRGNNSAVMSRDAREACALQLASVRELRLSLSNPPDESIVAAALMLCFAQVMSGSNSDSTWRLHLEGVASLFAMDAPTWSVHSTSQSKAIICKCYVSLAAIANVSSHPPSPIVSQQALGMLGRGVSCHYIDDFTAYSTELMYVLFEIGDLLRQRQTTRVKSTTISGMALASQSSRLLHRLTSMATVCRSRLNNNNTRHQRVDELFHFAAMLQISQRLKGLLPSSIEVQHLTVQILSLLREIKLQKGPNIGVLLFFPAFSAGAGAVEGPHRQQIRGLLKNMVRNMGFVNLRHGLDVLEALWAHRDRYGESNANASWESFVGGLDVILY